MQTIGPLCLSCVRKHKNRITCDAFPAGIPAGVYWRAGDHRKPVNGDHGVRFQQDPAVPVFDFTIMNRPTIKQRP